MTRATESASRHNSKDSLGNLFPENSLLPLHVNSAAVSGSIVANVAVRGAADKWRGAL
jgi:hypothetical protein